MCDGVPEQVGQACQVFRVWAQTCLSGELWPRREIPAKVPLCKCLNGSNLDAGEQSTNPWLSLNRLDHNYPHLSCSVSTSVSSPFSSFLRGNVTLSQRQVCSSAWTWPDLFSFIRICTVVHLVHRLHLVRWVFHSLLVCVCERDRDFHLKNQVKCSTSTGSRLRRRWCPGSRKLIAPRQVTSTFPMCCRGGKFTDKDGHPLTSTLFLSSVAELTCGRSIEFVPLLWSLSVHTAGVEMIRPTCSVHRAK